MNWVMNKSHSKDLKTQEAWTFPAALFLGWCGRKRLGLQVSELTTT